MVNHAWHIEKYWQEKSPAFSNQYQTFLGIPLTPVGFFLQARHRRISLYLKDLSGNMVVDIGCGSGVFMSAAIEQGKYVIGVDYSQHMIAIAQKNLKTFSKKRYRLIKANATKIPLQNRSVDIVLAVGLTEYLTKEDGKLFLNEVKRLLKPKGHAIITFAKKNSPFSFLREGFGLSLRKSLLHLPAVQSVYMQKDISELFLNAHLDPVIWDQVFSTMYIVIAKKQ